MITINSGKFFEHDFKQSVSEECYLERIPDPAQSFGGSNQLRFSNNNPYDFFLYKFPYLFCLELKSKKTNSLTYYKEEFVTDKKKKNNFDIKKHQIEGLRKASCCHGVIAGFLLNFRSSSETFFLPIASFDQLIIRIDKKSFNLSDVKSVPHIKIESILKKTHSQYDISKFISEASNITKENKK